MTYAWARTGLWLHSSCADCGLTYTGDERDLLRWQRGHGTATCVQRRAETARAVIDVDRCRNDHEYTPENTRVDANGRRHCQTCARANTARHSEARRWARAARHGQEKEAS